MKAIQYLAPDTIGVNDIPEPSPGPGEALVEISFTGICGTDMAIRAGKHPRAKPPLTLGHELSGYIRDSNGSGKFRDGDLVTVNPLITCGQCWSCRNGLDHICYNLRLYGIDAPGSMARYMTIPVSNLHRLPESVDMAHGALAEPVAVGIHAVNLGNPRSSDRVVVMGAGPIGLITALCLRRKGIENIIVSDLCDFRIKLAAELGFETVDVRTKNLKEVVLKWTNGDGADAVYEVSGHPSAVVGITDVVRCRGLIMMVSVHKDERPVDLRSVNFKEITLWGCRCYSNDEFAEAVGTLEELPVGKLISHRLPIDSAVEGFDAMLKPGTSCKVLFDLQ